MEKFTPELRRLAASLRRWGDILAYSLIGALAAFPTGNILAQSTDKLLPLLALDSPLASLWFKFSAAFVFISLVLWKSGSRPNHFRHLISFPPTSVAVPVALFGAGILLSLQNSQKIEKQDLCPLFSSALLILTIILAIWLWHALRVFSRRKYHDHSKAAGFNEDGLITLSTDELQGWLSNEAPLHGNDIDLFRSRRRALQAWSAISKRRNNVDGRELKQNVVIQGPFDAGKSTIVSLLEAMALEQSENRYVFVHVNCWGFSSLAAQEHILETAVNKLAQVADCLSLRYMPHAYADAIREANS